MSEHTPGPWEVDAEDSHKVASEDYGTIAWTPNEPAEMPPIMAEMRANARLIAAAPDLLKALRYLLGGVLDTEEQGVGLPTAVSRARAAIAKAEGRPS
jgi:hypothetical protein